MSHLIKRPTICIYAKREDSVLLLIQQKNNLKKYLVFPGGKMEKTDKNLEDCILRELNEELQYKANKSNIIKVRKDPIIAKTPKGNLIELHLYLHEIESTSFLFEEEKLLIKTEDIIGYKWMPLSEDINVYSKKVRISLVGPIIETVYMIFKKDILNNLKNDE